METKSEKLVSRKGAKADCPTEAEICLTGHSGSDLIWIYARFGFRGFRILFCWLLGAINFLAIRVLGVMCGMG